MKQNILLIVLTFFVAIAISCNNPSDMSKQEQWRLEQWVYASTHFAFDPLEFDSLQMCWIITEPNHLSCDYDIEMLMDESREFGQGNAARIAFCLNNYIDHDKSKCLFLTALRRELQMMKKDSSNISAIISLEHNVERVIPAIQEVKSDGSMLLRDEEYINTHPDSIEPLRIKLLNGDRSCWSTIDSCYIRAHKPFELANLYLACAHLNQNEEAFRKCARLLIKYSGNNPMAILAAERVFELAGDQNSIDSLNDEIARVFND